MEKKFTGQRFFDLKANEETIIIFPKYGIRYAQIVAPLEPDQHIRINYDATAAEDDNSYCYDSLMSSFEVVDDSPIKRLHLLANVDVRIQLINPRSVY